MDPRPGGEWSAVMLYGPDEIEIPFSGRVPEVVEPERLVITVIDPADPDAATCRDLDRGLRDLGDERTQMTFKQRGGNLPADEYSRAMRGSLIFFDRMAEHLGETLKARHDTA